jgi:hypothetical protein
MFRVGIRDVLWLTVVAALVCAWWVERAAIKNERYELAAERELLKAQRREFDAKFLLLVDAQDRLNAVEAKLDRQLESADGTRK